MGALCPLRKIWGLPSSSLTCRRPGLLGRRKGCRARKALHHFLLMNSYASCVTQLGCLSVRSLFKCSRQNQLFPVFFSIFTGYCTDHSVNMPVYKFNNAWLNE